MSAYPYALRSLLTPAQMRDKLRDYTLEDLRTRPRHVYLTPDAVESSLVQDLAVVLAPHVKFDASRRTAYIYEDGVWRQNKVGLHQWLAALLYKRRTSDGATISPWVRPVYFLDEDTVADAQKEAIAAGLVNVVDKAIVDQRTGEPFEFLDYYTITKNGQLAPIETEVSQDPLIAVSGNDWDYDVNGLNTPRGWFDLATGTLSPHSPEKLATKISKASPTAGTETGQWRKLVEELVPDQELRDFLQRACGMALSGDPREQAFVVLRGPGSSGKSLFMECVMHALGDYAGPAMPTILQPGAGNQHPTEIMALHGQRIVTISEPSANARWDVAAIKRITGNDALAARRLYQDTTSFTPTHTLFVLTNHIPNVPAADPAFWRRYYEIAFVQEFVEEGIELKPGQKRADKRLARFLKDHCADEIFAWLLEGWEKYNALGLRPPKSVLEARQDAKTHGSHLGHFLSERVVIDDTAAPMPAILLFDLWKAYKEKNPQLRRVKPNGEKDIRMVAQEIGAVYRPAEHGSACAVIEGVRLTDRAWDEIYPNRASRVFDTWVTRKSYKDYIEAHRPE